MANLSALVSESLSYFSHALFSYYLSFFLLPILLSNLSPYSFNSQNSFLFNLCPPVTGLLPAKFQKGNGCTSSESDGTGGPAYLAS